MHLYRKKHKIASEELLHFKGGKNMNDLELYREQLAECDDRIIDALVERNSIIEKIMAYKEEYGIPILQPQQEKKQQRQIKEKLQDNRYEKEIEDVFHCIVRNSKRIQAQKLFSYNIILIGFMGAGKSTVSQYLKDVFAMHVVEMDQLIAEREDMSIPDIFATYGEEYFRNLETNLLIEMQATKNTIVSCGGGAALREQNVKEMKKNGKVVLLTAAPETILNRVKDSDERPLLNGNKNVEFIANMMEQRRQKYETAADVIIHTDNKSVLQICEEMIAKLKEA
ncbi:shikimate kinase [[Clostridium] nexile DSM 1787]|nr:shikimate kinase [[Clostridium] nexile DSM 1787]